MQSSHTKQLIGEVILAMSEFELFIFQIINNKKSAPNDYRKFGILLEHLKDALYLYTNNHKGIPELIRDVGELNKLRNIFAHEVLLANQSKHPDKIFLSKNRKNLAWFKILDGFEIEEKHKEFFRKRDILKISLVKILGEGAK